MQIKAGMSLDSKTEPHSSDPMVNGKILVRIDLQARLIARLSLDKREAATITTTIVVEAVEEHHQDQEVAAREVVVAEEDKRF